MKTTSSFTFIATKANEYNINNSLIDGNNPLMQAIRAFIKAKHFTSHHI